MSAGLIVMNFRLISFEEFCTAVFLQECIGSWRYGYIFKKWRDITLVQQLLEVVVVKFTNLKNSNSKDWYELIVKIVKP